MKINKTWLNLVKISIFCLGSWSIHANDIEVFLSGFICAAAWVFVCVVHKSVGVVTTYAPLNAGSSPCLCSSPFCVCRPTYTE
jgi:hypothetical protein